ncbi:MAG: hypothetical protein ACFB0B_03320 [Thermonemataceae bacterium]
MEQKGTLPNRSDRIAPLLGLALTLIIGMISYYSYSLIGFPDGHLTTYAHFSKSVLYPLFFVVNALFIVYFLWFAIKGNKRYWILALYVAFLLLSVIVAHYYSLHLENGQGG